MNILSDHGARPSFIYKEIFDAEWLTSIQADNRPALKNMTYEEDIYCLVSNITRQNAWHHSYSTFRDCTQLTDTIPTRYIVHQPLCVAHVPSGMEDSPL